jgi:3-hydroxyisobutyrate dehydrogenase-like beta-hydroxyacid dehydrogenase
MPLKVGFIGVGEVCRCLAPAMEQRGVEVAGFDADAAKAAGGIRLLPLAELIGWADYVLSTVTVSQAVIAAQSCALHLSPGKVYVDLNSTSPEVKRRIEAIIAAPGADFVEGAILGAVCVSGARTRILTGGKKGRIAAETLAQAGLAAVFYSEETGKASTFKMLRSIFSKGLEALILELLVAGRRAGIEKDLWADISEFMSGHSFDEVAGNWVRSHGPACERRRDEMAQVNEVLRDIGMEGLMSEATEAFFRRSSELGLREKFPLKAASTGEVVAFLEGRLR